MDPKEKNKEASKNQQEVLQHHAAQKDENKKIEQSDSKTLREMLSNKNNDYVFKLEKELQKGGLSAAAAKDKVNSLLVEIVIAQKNGQPAYILFGKSPIEEAQELLHPKKEIKPTKFWQRAVDSGLLYLVIFTAIVGISALASQKETATNQFGIVTLLSVGALFGVLMTYYNDLLGGKARPKFWKIILGGLGIMAILVAWITWWQMPFMKPVNPALPGWADLVIAAVAYLGRRVFRTRYHITTSTLLPAPRNKTRD